ncbi:MAG: SOS response-associated peptidase [Fibrobacterota bacterium]
MCGRFCLACGPETLAARFKVVVDPSQYTITYNAAPTQTLPVITNEAPEKISFFRWGLIPFWAKDKSIGNKMINARAETLHEKPAFREGLKKRRCLIPASGFYEWKKDGNHKQPYFIGLEGKEVFAFAGLWDSWSDPSNQETTHSFTIITTETNERLKPIHNRMPVILAQKAEQTWLTGELPKEELKAFPSDKMKAFTVSTRVNSVSHNSADLMEYYEPHGKAVVERGTEWI